MKNRNTRLFELLVVGGGLWIVSGCGAATDPSTQNPTQSSVVRVSPDGGVVDGGTDTIPPGGNGSGFW